MIFKGYKSKDGQTEEFNSFAWLPVTLETGDVIWLEKIKVFRTYWWGPLSNSIFYDDKVYALRDFGALK